MFEEIRRQSKIEVAPSLKGTQAEKSLRIGVLFSGGPAAGGANVVAGLFDSKNTLIGFLGGPSGILEEKYKILTKEEVDQNRNLGGFDLLGTGRTKIETEEQFQKAKEVVEKLKLDGLVIIGGDDSNTNAYFLHKYLKGCSVIGVPKTIDGDLKSKEIEISFGFDTACKVYSQMIGNIGIDAKSSLKYWHFIKLMGRTASHVTLECALQTRPNIALIGEEIRHKKMSLNDIVKEIADTVDERAKAGKNYGVILIPEGIIEFIGDKGLLTDLDSHGNVKVSQIETEKLLSGLVETELKKRGSLAKFSPLHHFFGYEGRCSYPSEFDATYCYNLGLNAARLVQEKKSGIISAIQNVAKPVAQWKPTSVPIEPLLVQEERKGQMKQVIAKALVDLNGPVFKTFLQQRAENRLEDHYLRPGPMQFSSPLKDLITKTLSLERA